MYIGVCFQGNRIARRMIDIKRDMIAAKFTNYFPSLANTHFRFYWFGQIVLNIGLSMQEVAQLWLIYSITKSAFLLSLVGILQYAPMLFLSLFAGALIDKFCTGKLLKITHIHVYGYFFYDGRTGFFGRHGVLVYFYRRNRSGLFQYDGYSRKTSLCKRHRTQGYTHECRCHQYFGLPYFEDRRSCAGGDIMSGAGIGYCYLLAGLCCFPMLLMLFKHKADAVKAEVNINLRSFWQDIKKGVSYALNTKDMFKTILGASIMSVLLNNFSVFLPVLANTMNQRR